MPLEHAVSELVGQPFIFELREVMRTGLNCASTGMPAQLEIDHQLQTSYDDYEYRALKNESGEVYCMLHTATDVTEKI